MRGDRFAAADRVDALVGLSLDAHAGHIDADRAVRPTRASRRRGRESSAPRGSPSRRRCRPRSPCSAASATARRKQIEARRALPARIGVRKMKADVAQARGAENRVGHRVADDVGIGVAERAAVRRDRHAAEHERPSLRRADADRSRCRRGRFDGWSLEFGSGSPLARRCRLRSAPAIASASVRSSGRRDLDVRRFAFDDAHRLPGALGERRLVGRIERRLRRRCERLARTSRRNACGVCARKIVSRGSV